MSGLATWTPTITVGSGTGELDLPTTFEARCYQLYRLEQMSQPQIAVLLKTQQSRVSRGIRRVEAKLEDLIASGRFDREELELLMRKLTATAPRTKVRQRRRRGTKARDTTARSRRTRAGSGT